MSFLPALTRAKIIKNFKQNISIINDAVKEIKEQDADFNVTYSMIRHLIWTGKLTKIKYGSAWLVNMDELYAFFWGELK